MADMATPFTPAAKAGTARDSRETAVAVQMPNAARLAEIADLLALGIARLAARQMPVLSGESSTGLVRETERVLTPENGL